VHCAGTQRHQHVPTTTTGTSGAGCGSAAGARRRGADHHRRRDQAKRLGWTRRPLRSLLHDGYWSPSLVAATHEHHGVGLCLGHCDLTSVAVGSRVVPPTQALPRGGLVACSCSSHPTLIDRHHRRVAVRSDHHVRRLTPTTAQRGKRRTLCSEPHTHVEKCHAAGRRTSSPHWDRERQSHTKARDSDDAAVQPTAASQRRSDLLPRRARSAGASASSRGASSAMAAMGRATGGAVGHKECQGGGGQ